MEKSIPRENERVDMKEINVKREVMDMRESEKMNDTSVLNLAKI